MQKTRLTLLLGIIALTASLAGIACGDGGTSSSGPNGSRDSVAPDNQQTTGLKSTAGDQPGRTSGTTAATAAAGDSGATGEGGSGTSASIASQLDRKIIFNAKLDMTAEDVHASFAEASRLARNAGGFVEKSSVYGKNGESGTERTYATLTLRVPVKGYQDVLEGLRGLPGGKVVKEESGSREVTDQYTDLQSRLRNLERSEAQYLKLLEQAKTIQEIMTVNDRLDSIRLQIERIQGQMNVLDDLSDLATIDIAMSPPVPGKAKQAEGGPRSPQEAFADAWAGSLEAARYAAAAGAALAAVAIWLAVPVGLALGATFFARRRHPSAPSTPSTPATPAQ